jgi:hypothetical protein
VKFGAGVWKYPKIETVDRIDMSWLEIYSIMPFVLHWKRKVERYQIKLIVYEPVSEAIERWIN